MNLFSTSAFTLVILGGWTGDAFKVLVSSEIAKAIDGEERGEHKKERELAKYVGNLTKIPTCEKQNK